MQKKFVFAPEWPISGKQPDIKTDTVPAEPVRPAEDPVLPPEEEWEENQKKIPPDFSSFRHMDPGVKVRQLQYENESASRTLEFLLQENAVLKTRLAELLPEKGLAGDFLAAAELYQGCFIRKDEIINLMRQDITELNGMLTRMIYGDGGFKKIMKKQKQVRVDLRKLQDAFNDLKNRFNGYLDSLE